MIIGHQPNDPVTQLAGWVSALWGVGLIYFTATQGVQQVESTKGDPLKDLEFAVKYAQNLLEHWGPRSLPCS